VGVKITLENGRTITAIANYEPQGVTVQLGSLQTKERFACDWSE